jgi:ribonuclease E
MLMPSHAKNVKLYDEPVPLFQRYHIEAQLDSMFTPTVTLKSGGYIVINQTEALVSIDVNSGRATREHNIEETARKTNLEAADEVGRQLRLRDLAGLIVIDFIDMEDGRNDREVEKRMHNAVKNDRARVQIGKISQFGLLEMSRQRLRAGVVAGSTVACPHCAGQGIVRSVESNALRVLRAVEEEAAKRRAAHLNVSIAADVAIYILNQKRRELSRIETDYGVAVGFVPTNEPVIGHFEIERVGQRSVEDRPRPPVIVSVEAGFGGEPISEEVEAEEEIEEQDKNAEEESEEALASSDEERGESQEREGNDDGRRRRRRRRRGGRGRGERSEQGERPQQQAQGETTIQDPGAESFSTNEHGEAVASGEEGTASGEAGEGEGGRRRRRRRRGRRGSRRDGENFEGQPAQASAESDAEGDTDTETHVPAPAPAPAAPSYSSYDRFGTVDEIDTTPREDARPQPNTESSPVWNLNAEPDTTPVADDKPAAPPRKGWWQRAFKSED